MITSVKLAKEMRIVGIQQNQFGYIDLDLVSFKIESPIEKPSLNEALKKMSLGGEEGKMMEKMFSSIAPLLESFQTAQIDYMIPHSHLALNEGEYEDIGAPRIGSKLVLQL